MNRYHKDVYIPAGNNARLHEFTKAINAMQWSYTAHCLDNIKHRAIDCEGLLYFIKGLELSPESIFEYYTEGAEIIKVCYRIKYLQSIDIILVISNTKSIVTVYMNSANDKHYTLRKELYCTP